MVCVLLACAACLTIPDAASARRGPWPLRVHSQGDPVRALQENLTRLGYATTADGAFGRRTRRSVRAYERARRIVVDGRVTHRQWRGIESRAGSAGDVTSAPDRNAPEGTAVIGPDGRTALVPADAPPAVAAAIEAANRLVRKPYRYGGGHGSFKDSGYDCSGAVSYVLHGAGLLRRPRASSGFESYGAVGRGAWITVFAHGGHAYMIVAGLRFDTSGRGESGPRWRPERRSPRGYVIRHPRGL